MHKITACIVTAFLFLVISSNCVAQTETFDIVTYTPPKSWEKNIKDGVLIYTDVNATTGGYCVIAIYAGTQSAGDAQKDFAKEWKNLAVTPYNADSNAIPETVTIADGWKQLTAVSKIKHDSDDAAIMLSVFSGFGKTTSILINLNDQSYLPLVDSLVGNVKLDKTEKTPKSLNAKNETVKNDLLEEKFGHMVLPPLNSWTLKKFSNAATLVLYWRWEDNAPGLNFKKQIEENFPVVELKKMIDN